MSNAMSSRPSSSSKRIASMYMLAASFGLTSSIALSVHKKTLFEREINQDIIILQLQKLCSLRQGIKTICNGQKQYLCQNTSKLLLNLRESTKMAFVAFNISRSHWMWYNGTSHLSLLGL